MCKCWKFVLIEWMSTLIGQWSWYTDFFFFFFFWLRWVFVDAWAFSSCGERGLLFVTVRRLLIAVTSRVAEHRL